VFKAFYNTTTFQVMINNFLKDIIEAEDVAVFINDVMVEMELEKYIWKVKEVGFLRVIIGLDGVKIEEEKI